VLCCAASVLGMHDEGRGSGESEEGPSVDDGTCPTKTFPAEVTKTHTAMESSFYTATSCEDFHRLNKRLHKPP
jgi:hypothetical protein